MREATRLDANFVRLQPEPTEHTRDLLRRIVDETLIHHLNQIHAEESTSPVCEETALGDEHTSD